MTDNWDDSDDEWDVDDDALDKKLGLKKDDNNFDDEEDLALKEQADAEKLMQVDLKKKGSALVAKKNAEKERKEELEIARKAMELEAEMEANMTPDEQRALERQRIEDADNALTDDLFGSVDKMSVSAGAQQAGDKVVMKDMKDHMKHARKVAECMKVRTYVEVENGQSLPFLDARIRRVSMISVSSFLKEQFIHSICPPFFFALRLIGSRKNSFGSCVLEGSDTTKQRRIGR
jgi:acetyl/propionyl-CoA carboxylase alpha subunit